MAVDAHQNLAVSTVATAPSPATSGTTLIVAAGQGALFPAAPFNVTIWPAATQPTTANAEIARVTNVSTDTFTIVRATATEPTAIGPRAILVGDQISATITAKTLTDVETSFAPLASPAFTGVPTAPTAATATNTTQLATTQYVQANVALLTPLIPVVGSTGSSTGPAPDYSQKMYSLTALATGATFVNPTGVPANGQTMIIRVKDNGTARALAWGTAYTPGGVALPTTTVISKILTVGFIYNSDNSLNKLQCIAVSQEA